MQPNDSDPTSIAVPEDDQPGILLLDDDPFMLAMQARVLRTMGYSKVQSARSADAALALMQENSVPVDIIICDLNMPGTDGIEFLQVLNEGTFQGSVILHSGEGVRIMHTVQKLIGTSGMTILGSLEKPPRRAALRALLDCWKPREAVPAAAMPAFKFSEADLHVAQRELQWVLHYQPKVRLSNGELTGMEALVRWNEPQQGLLAPDIFIGVAEECGAIDALTQWVLQEAMHQQALWSTQGMRIQMAVNVSMENLRAKSFAQSVGELARSCGVLPQDVMLEITESRLMSTSSIPLESLVRLRMLRFGLSIDDFGTGHSTLVQLRDVPFTELKIDRGFVQGARYNQIIRPILEGSIGIAKRLEMKSVAEGVETEDDWHLMREVGCDFAQGWFIGRAMPADQIPVWIEAWEARRARLVDR